MEPSGHYRLHEARIWLLLLVAVQLRSPFLPWLYGIVTPIWLLTLFVPAASNGIWKFLPFGVCWPWFAVNLPPAYMTTSTEFSMIYTLMGNGEVDLAGSGNVEISPISDETDIYWGVSIFQSRSNYLEARVIGTSDTILEGTYYFPNNHLELGGEGIAVGNQLIAYTLDIHGDGTYTLHYDGRFTSPGYKVWLVE